MKRLIYFFRRRFDRYPHYVIVGISTAVVSLLVTFVLTDIVGFWYFFSFIIATIVGCILNFALNSRFTFRGHDAKFYFSKYVNYSLFYILMGIFNLSIVYILTSIFFLHYLISIIIAGSVISLITFSFNKRVVFNVN